MSRPTPASSSRWTGTPGEFRPPRWASPQKLLPDGRPWPTAGRLVTRFQERCLVHGEGDALGERVRLAMFERYINLRMWEYHPETGKLAHDRVLLILPKGNSKTERAGALADTELVGPIAPRSPRIVLAAASYDQSKEAFNAATLAIKGDGDEKAGPLYPFFRDGDHLLEDRILNPEGHGYIQRIAAVGGTSDGGKPTQFIGDELHEWVTERQRRVYVVQGKSIRKRKVIRRTPAALGLPEGVQLHGGMQVGITTIGADRGTLLGELYEHGVKVAKGEVVDPGFLFLCWQADEGWDLEDPDQLVQAILQANPAVGEFLPLENVIASYRDPTVSRSEFLRYNLNLWPDNVVEDAWMDSGAWADCDHPELELDPARPTFAVVRIAHDHRFAAVAVAQRHGEHVRVRCWMFDDLALVDDDALDLTPIERHLEELRRTFRAEVLASKRFSPKGKEYLRPSPGPSVAYNGAFFARSAQLLQGKGLVMVDLPNTPARIGPAAETLMGMVLGHQLEHDGDPDLAAQMSSLVGRETTVGWTLAPGPELRPGVPRRVEGALATVLVVHRAMTEPVPERHTVKGIR